MALLRKAIEERQLFRAAFVDKRRGVRGVTLICELLVVESRKKPVKMAAALSQSRKVQVLLGYPDEEITEHHAGQVDYSTSKIGGNPVS